MTMFSNKALSSIATLVVVLGLVSSWHYWGAARESDLAIEIIGCLKEIRIKSIRTKSGDRASRVEATSLINRATQNIESKGNSLSPRFTVLVKSALQDYRKVVLACESANYDLNNGFMSRHVVFNDDLDLLQDCLERGGTFECRNLVTYIRADTVVRVLLIRARTAQEKAESILLRYPTGLPGQDRQTS